jgi:hypothetical protein
LGLSVELQQNAVRRGESNLSILDRKIQSGCGARG